MTTHLSFGIKRRDVSERILIPKFYDPDLEASRVIAEAADFDLPSLGDLLGEGSSGSRLGNWIRREHYGSGEVPYVRTSDLAHWRIRPEFKKGVSVRLYESLRDSQDVKANDILFVAHGTYLVGNVALVTESDNRLVLQDHIFRLRANRSCGIHPYVLLAALSTSFVRRQVRARQFSADIIDKVGNRHLEIHVPIPRDISLRDEVVGRVQSVLRRQAALRKEMERISQSKLRLTRERADSKYQFAVRRGDLVGRILIPKYYDPDLNRDLRRSEKTYGEEWLSLGDLMKGGFLSATTGKEVGKMAYGTGLIPFLRTSDLAEWEVQGNVKQGVGEEIFSKFEESASTEANDVLLVRDGTYLVGSTGFVIKEDCPALFCGGMYRLRMFNCPKEAPFALLAFLNLSIVRRQMRARQFTRDVIDTLGHRLMEVRIPSPLSELGRRVGLEVAQVVGEKSKVKSDIKAIIGALEPPVAKRAMGRPGWSMR